MADGFAQKGYGRRYYNLLLLGLVAYRLHL